jgi:hypothetical protein
MEAFTTERAVRNGRANAASGRILVNVPNDHFGPILAEHDPEKGRVRSDGSSRGALLHKGRSAAQARAQPTAIRGFMASECLPVLGIIHC